MIDSLAQIALHFAVILIGFLQVHLLVPKELIATKLCFGFFVGWGVVCLSYIIIILVGHEVNLGNLTFILLFYFLVILISNFKNNQFNYKKVFEPTGLFICSLITLSIISVVVLFFDFIRFSPDSSQYEAASFLLQHYGKYYHATPGYEYWIFNMRLPLFLAANNFANQLGIVIFHSFTPMAAISLTGALFFCFISSEKLNLPALCWSLVLVIWLVGSPMIRMHSFFFHTNLITAAYFSLAIVSIHFFLKWSSYTWFYLGLFLLGIGCLTRLETYLFGLIPVSYVWICSSKLELKKNIIGFSLFPGLPLIWSLFGISIGEGFPEYVTLVAETHRNHGEWIVPAFSFIVSAFLFFIILRNAQQKALVISTGMIAYLVCIIFYRWDEATIRFYELQNLMFHHQSVWSTTWKLILMTLVLYFVSRVIFLIQRNRKSELFSHSVQIFPYSILFFFAGWLFLYSFSPAVASNWGGSGNRILLHIYPICVYFGCLFGRELFQEILSDRN